MEFSIKDELRAEVEIASGGKNTIMYDDYGNPNIMVCIPKYDMTYLGLNAGTHWAFTPDDNHVFREIWVSKYPNSIGIGGVPVSWHDQPPVYLLHDEAKKACRKKGKGWHMINNLEYCAVWHIAQAHNRMPQFERARFIERSNYRAERWPLSELTHDGTDYGVVSAVGTGEFVDGLEIRPCDMIYTWVDDAGIPRNDFENQVYKPFMRIDATGQNTGMHVYRINSIKKRDINSFANDGQCENIGHYKLSEAKYVNETGNANDGAIDENMVKVMGLLPIPVGVDNYANATWSRRQQLGLEPVYMIRCDYWGENSSPLSFSISFEDANKDPRICRAVYIGDSY